jgi:hypothetical protein
VILDLRTGQNQGLVTLYVKKSDVYNSKFSDMGMYFTTSQLFGICGNSPLDGFFQKLLYFLVVVSAAILTIYGIWFLGKKRLGDMGEMKFEREEQVKNRGFEMVDSGPRDLSTVDEVSEEDFDSELGAGDYEENYDYEFD